MFVSDCLNVNKKGHLTIGGCDTVSLAQEFSTPLFVMDEDAIRKTCRMYQNSLNEYYQGRGMVLYASKAFSCKEMCRIIKDEGIGLDVVSGGESFIRRLKQDFLHSAFIFMETIKRKRKFVLP